jgi:Asp-tRNA(Asn)/Glu-tRNA(Gln) amidotransferase A subunit family amidase
MNAIRGDFSDWRSRFLRRQVSPVEYVGLLELQCQSTEPQVSALVVSNWDQAKKLAAESDARYRKHEPLSPVDGLPFVVKDNIETAEFPTQMQSPIFAGYQSKRNAEVVRRLIDGGAIVVWKDSHPRIRMRRIGPNEKPA